jgi:hypothetical protein
MQCARAGVRGEAERNKKHTLRAQEPEMAGQRRQGKVREVCDRGICMFGGGVERRTKPRVQNKHERALKPGEGMRRGTRDGVMVFSDKVW